MEVEQEHFLSSIRAEEKTYEKEIRETYKDHSHLFVTHSSDLLNLRVSSLEKEGIKYQGLTANSSFQKYDILAQIRGSVIGFDKLNDLLKKKIVMSDKLPTLLYLSPEQRLLISPKNITKYLFTNPLYKFRLGQSLIGGPEAVDNCNIERHFDSKLLVVASRNISIGEELVLDQKSYDNFVFKEGKGVTT